MSERAGVGATHFESEIPRSRPTAPAVPQTGVLTCPRCKLPIEQDGSDEIKLICDLCLALHKAKLILEARR